MGILPMIILALTLALKNRGKVQSAVYNRSRNILVAATLLLATHNTIQYIGHFREQSATLCWSVNLVFYVLITPLYNMAELNLLRAGHNINRGYLDNSIYIAICYIILIIGYFTDTLVNDEQPWMTTTFFVAFLYFCKLIKLSWVLNKEMRIANARLTDEELTERHNALSYTAKVMKSIIIISLLSPWIGMSSSLLFNSLFGISIFITISLFLIKFIEYGENMTDIIKVNDEITEAVMMEAESNNADDIQTECAAEYTNCVQQRIEQWVSERRYTNPNITIREALREMGISVTALNYYLEHHTPIEGYRQWLPYLRIEEAKRIMQEHPEYSQQAVAEACGYANKSNLSRTFKSQEGVTPGQWLSAQNGGGKKLNV